MHVSSWRTLIHLRPCCVLYYEWQTLRVLNPGDNTQTTVDNGSNFFKALCVFGEDEMDSATEEVTEEDATQDDSTDNDGMEVEFIIVEAIKDEDNGPLYQLLKHHLCTCHLLNLVSMVDEIMQIEKRPASSSQDPPSPSLRLSGIKLQGPPQLQRWLTSTANISATA